MQILCGMQFDSKSSSTLPASEVSNGCEGLAGSPLWKRDLPLGVGSG